MKRLGYNRFGRGIAREKIGWVIEEETRIPRRSDHANAGRGRGAHGTAIGPETSLHSAGIGRPASSLR